MKDETKESTGTVENPSARDTAEQDKKFCAYWLGQLRRAEKKQPSTMWKKAEDRYGAKEVRNLDIKDDTSNSPDWPVVNDTRNHIESSMSYLDQTHPSFSVTPTKPYQYSPEVIKQAECDLAYLEYVWAEQDCQAAESKKLNSALLRNIGITLPVFDHKKWMPTIKYIPPKRVRLDPDCDGDYESMAWQAYYEDCSIETVKSMHPELSNEQIKKINRKSTMSEEEQRGADDSEIQSASSIRVWHIFARNDAATRMSGETDPAKIPSLADELQLNTPRRYIQLAEGLDKPLVDAKKWPFDLDHNEMPMTFHQVNFEDDDLYGFSDQAQMERMDLMKDAVMSYIEEDCRHAAVRKFGGPSDTQIDEVTVRNFLENDEMAYLPSAVEADGKPKIMELTRGIINPSMKDSYELIHEQSIKASGQSELMAENLADLKEVTALGVQYHENKLHQRVNRRLAGPRGYEQSIRKDAIKVMEIAHQKVPRMSVVAVKQNLNVPMEGMMVPQTKEVPQSLPWPDALKAIQAGGTLVKLGADAIVGPDLAQFWVTTEDAPLEYFRLSTNLTVVPGSTRTITNAEKVQSLSDFYVNALFPTLYQPLMRFDLAAKFLKHVAQLSGSIESVERFIPEDEEIQQSVQALQAQQQQQQGISPEDQLNLEQQKMDMDNQQKTQQMDIEAAKAQHELQHQQAKAVLDIQKGKAQIQNLKQKKDVSHASV